MIWVLAGIYAFGQIAAMVALANIIVSAIRRIEQNSVDKKGGDDEAN
jgi:hypothetical protein